MPLRRLLDVFEICSSLHSKPTLPSNYANVSVHLTTSSTIPHPPHYNCLIISYPPQETIYPHRLSVRIPANVKITTGVSLVELENLLRA